MSVFVAVSQATFEEGSPSKQASRMASETFVKRRLSNRDPPTQRRNPYLVADFVGMAFVHRLRCEEKRGARHDDTPTGRTSVVGKCSHARIAAADGSHDGTAASATNGVHQKECIRHCGRQNPRRNRQDICLSRQSSTVAMLRSLALTILGEDFGI